MFKTIVAHQSQYFPQLELYSKILKSNKFVLLDNVKFKNNAWHARTIIKDKTDHIIQLIIPCSKKKSLIKKLSMQFNLKKNFKIPYERLS